YAAGSRPSRSTAAGDSERESVSECASSATTVQRCDGRSTGARSNANSTRPTAITAAIAIRYATMKLTVLSAMPWAVCGRLVEVASTETTVLSTNSTHHDQMSRRRLRYLSSTTASSST